MGADIQHGCVVLCRAQAEADVTSEPSLWVGLVVSWLLRRDTSTPAPTLASLACSFSLPIARLPITSPTKLLLTESIVVSCTLLVDVASLLRHRHCLYTNIKLAFQARHTPPPPSSPSPPAFVSPARPHLSLAAVAIASPSSPFPPPLPSPH